MKIDNDCASWKECNMPSTPADSRIFTVLLADERAFHLEEYKQLKQEMSGLLARIETLSRLGLVTAALVFSWLAVQGFGPGTESNSWCTKLPPNLFKPAWFLPFVFATLSGLASLAAYQRGCEIAEYLRGLEALLGARGLGWEQRLEEKPSVLSRSAKMYWCALLLGTLVFGAVGWVAVESANAPCAPSSASR